MVVQNHCSILKVYLVKWEIQEIKINDEVTVVLYAENKEKYKSKNP
jgi:hypothetical protein